MDFSERVGRLGRWRKGPCGHKGFAVRAKRGLALVHASVMAAIDWGLVAIGGVTVYGGGSTASAAVVVGAVDALMVVGAID